MTYTSEYPIFYVTVDVVALTVLDEQLCALVVRRGSEPHAGRWALPGGFVEPEETLESAARRELEEETAVPEVASLTQLAAYGDPGRDPRGRIVSVAWLAVVPAAPQVQGGSDASRAEWRPVTSLRDEDRLAFDHDRILADGLDRASSLLERTDLATAFLDEEFTIAELRRVYEIVWGRRLDPGNFHRKITGGGLVEPTGGNQQRGPGRPAATFRRRPGADGLTPPLARSALL